jgi:hypothetical protein
MTEKQKNRIELYLKEYSKKANKSWGDDDIVGLHNYWQGQVMGMCKIIDAMKLDIDTEFYLNNLL